MNTHQTLAGSASRPALSHVPIGEPDAAISIEPDIIAQHFVASRGRFYPNASRERLVIILDAWVTGKYRFTLLAPAIAKIADAVLLIRAHRAKDAQEVTQ